MIKPYKVLPALGLVVLSLALQAQPSIGGYNVYYGHLHNHSAVSDGVNSPQDAYRYARESGHLDFFGLSDHSNYIHDDEWDNIKNAADEYYRPGEFTTFWGFEWTDEHLGHVTVVNSQDYTTPSWCNSSFSCFCSWLEDRDCVAFFNHPGRYNSNGHEFEHFEGTPTGRMVGIELWNRTERFERFFSNDGYFHGDGNKSFYDEALTRGWKIGASGSEDNHSGNWGNATDSKLAVLASENSREDIYEALKARRFFSTYDKNLVVSFRIDGHEMGSEVYAGNQPLHIEAADGDNEIFSRMELIKNGAVIQSWTPYTNRVTIQEALNCGHGDYFYLHVMQEDGDEAITSPIHISRVNRLPVASLVRPAPNSNYLNPASVTFMAEAEDTDGDIEKVEFYLEEQLVGESFDHPYACTWECTSTGTFRIQVRAIDNRGGQAVSRPVNIVVTNPGEPVTITSRIGTDSDDVEESSVGSLSGNRRSTDIELVDDFGTRGENQKVGLRFTELNLPQGVYITHAWVQFTCDEVSTGPCELIMEGEASGNSAPFNMELYDVSARERTQAKVRWLPEPWLTEKETGMAQRTPDLKTIVQEIINRADYVPGAAITMIVTGSGTRTAVSYEGSAPGAALMLVTYSYTRPNDPPAVTLTSPENNATLMAPALVAFSADATDADGEISKVDFYQGDTVLYTTDHAPYTFDWKDVAEGTYLLKAVATDNKGDTAVSGTVSVTVLPEVVSRTFASPISSPADDAEESCKGVVSLNGDDIELVYDSHSQGRQTVGLRFNKVDIPGDAVIKKAFIQFTADERTTMGCTLEIQGEDADCAREFNNADRNVSGRSRTKSAVGWIVPRWTRVGQHDHFEQTPDLKNIVQEVINRPGWTPGNSLSFIITGLGLGKRTAASFEASLQKAARLVVQYELTIYRKTSQKQAQ